MANQVPFTAHIKVVPHRGQSTDTQGSAYKELGHVRRGSRGDHIRDLQRLAIAIYEELDDVATITLPAPGGGQARLYGFISNTVYGGAVKPQIGNQPALVMIEGFARKPEASHALLVRPFANKPVIHGGNYMTGDGGQWAWDDDGGPNTDVEAEVIELKQVIESAISVVSDDSGEALSLFRLQYKSATWGDGGHHFPRG